MSRREDKSQGSRGILQKFSSTTLELNDFAQPLMQNNVREKFIRLVSKPLSKRFRHPKGEPGFRDGRFHSFRHFFVSQCFVQGVDEGTIRSWLGHSDSRILELYRHLAEKDSQRLMQKLDFSGKAKDE